jgi:hypothetical protein
VGFAAALVNLGPGGATTACPTPPTSTASCLIDGQLASGTKSGYSFAAVGSGGPPASAYQAAATPLTPNQTGVRYFCSFADAVVRYSAAVLSTTTCDGTVPALQ